MLENQKEGEESVEEILKVFEEITIIAEKFGRMMANFEIDHPDSGLYLTQRITKREKELKEKLEKEGTLNENNNSNSTDS